MFEKKEIKKNLKEIERKISEEAIWKDHTKLNNFLKQKNSINNFLNKKENLEIRFSDTNDLLQLSEKENDQNLISELESELIKIQFELNDLYIETLMNGQIDSKNCFLEIHAGAGGTESQDWVEMILRMYSRWAESKSYKVELIEQTDGEEAGLKSVTIKVSGDKSYGWLKYESGIHRLVRISPFDSQSRRHTSFASVSCFPEIDNSISIEIIDKDIRIDTYRASGAGGQHVNKTDSAVRITHIPTKISVQCQSSRSQHRNKNIAMEMLKSKLYEIRLKKEDEERKKKEEKKTEIGWGHQIRSYVMQPYQLVKDHRTNHEEKNVLSVLDGKIDRFLKSQLKEL